jgi:hypothetical protein
MQSPAGASPAPRPRSRRAPLATLLALAALATGAQALAPAGAAAMIAEPPTPTTCAAMMGSWINGACYIVDDAGNPVIKVNEISWATPGAPSGTRGCPICGVRAPKQIGDGAGSGSETSKGDSKGKGSGDVKGPADDKKAGKPKTDKKNDLVLEKLNRGWKPKTETETLNACESVKQTLKAYSNSIDDAEAKLTAYKNGDVVDFSELRKLVDNKKTFYRLYGKTIVHYGSLDCFNFTGRL